MCVHRLVHVIGYAESWSLRVSGQASVRDIVSVCVCVHRLVHVIGYAESWSLQVSGQASVRDIVCVSIALSMSLAMLNPGACGYLGSRQSVTSCLSPFHVIGYAGCWSLQVSWQASVRDIFFFLYIACFICLYSVRWIYSCRSARAHVQGD